MQGRLKEEEVCTRRCIGELHAVVLELLLLDFQEGGLRLSDPPSPVPTLLTRLERGGCSAAPPSGSVCGEEGWGHTHTLLPCPAPPPPAPQTTGTREGGRGGSATFIEGATCPTHQRWEWSGFAGS